MSDGSPYQPVGSNPYQQPAAPTPGGAPIAPPPGQPPAAAPAGSAGAGVSLSSGALLSLVAAGGLAAAVFIKEDSVQGWDSYGVWGIFAIVAALATAAPSMAAQFKLTPTRAWQVAVAGALGVALFWVLMILPSIERNLSFVATAATVLAGLAAWTAPGRPAPSGEAPPR